MAQLYPAESNHILDLNALLSPHVVFVVAKAQQQVLGFGALVIKDGYGEIKRMYTHPAHRGQGVGWEVLLYLERAALQNGLAVLRLETGIYQPEALRLYQRAGYTYIAPFGDYRLDPLSVFMEKQL